MSSGLDKLQERNLRLGVKSLIKEADSKTNLKERQIAFQEVLEYCDGIEEDFIKDFVTKANEEISKVKTQMEALAEKGSQLDSLQEEHKVVKETKASLEKKLGESTLALEDLNKKYEFATKMVDDFKEREQSLKEMYEIAVAEKNGMVEAEEYQQLFIKANEYKTLVNESHKEVSKLQRKVEALEDENKDLKESIKELKVKKENSMKKYLSKRYEAEEETDEEDEDKEEKKNEKVLPKRAYNQYSLREEDEDEYDFRETKEIQSYYRDLVEANPKVKLIKEQILKSKTLIEAQKTYLNLMDLVETSANMYIAKKKIDESHEKEDIAPSRVKSNLVRDGWL